MSAPERAELQRLRYWQGQMLRTRDFRDQAAIEAQLRWWHNRALHNTSGIVKGLNVTLPETQGKRSVTVSPGLAYDCFGRELIQCYEESIPVPAASEPLTLLARYKDVRVYPRKQDLSGVCVPGMVPLFKEKLEFIWKPSGKVQVPDGVPLARLTFTGGTPSLDNTFLAPRARPLARPRIASGATIPGQTPWGVWSASHELSKVGVTRRSPAATEDPPTLLFQANIDTSSAGFTETPLYFAQLQGRLWRRKSGKWIPAVHVAHIEDASNKEFTFRFMMLIARHESKDEGSKVKRAFLFGPEVLKFLRAEGFFVSWLGIEPGLRSRVGIRTQ